MVSPQDLGWNFHFQMAVIKTPGWLDFFSGGWQVKLPSYYIGITPWKINMEPKNHPIEKEIIFQTILFSFYVNLPRGIS